MKENQKVCQKTITLIGNKWILLIVNEFNAYGKPLRFNEVLEKMAPISSKTLAAKLKELVAHQILERSVTDDTPVSITYSLTQKGKDLAGLFQSMTKWGKKWSH